MGHAVGAFGIITNAVAIPVGLFHQRLECRRISLVHQQIAGPLPAEHIPCRVAPWRAAVTLVAGKEIQEQARVIEPPATLFAQSKNISEKLFARGSLNENVLLGRMLVTKTGRNGHALHADGHDLIEKGSNLFRGLALKQSAVNSDPEASSNRLLNCLYGFIKHAVAAHGSVMAKAIAVQMN